MKKYLYLVLGFQACVVFGSTKALKTTAELTHWKQTGRYVEVERLCKAFTKKFPQNVDCISFGKTPEGRQMRALVVADSKKGLLSFYAKKKKRPVVFVQGGIHAGEIDGKDAGFWLIREILENEANPKTVKALKEVTLVFVPVFNVDGHERFGKHNRPNQVGPEEMGWRTTAQNYNLNRDYMKVDSPEMKAMIQLLNQWDPLIALDLHVTDGAKFQHDVSIIMEPLFYGLKETREMALEIKEMVLNGLKTEGHLPLGFYPSFLKEDEPSSGFDLGVAPPRYSQGYLGVRNRVGMLVETHSWKDYATRVKAARNVVENTLLIIAEKGKQWRKQIEILDGQVSSQVGQEMGLAFKNSEKKKEEISFLGYHYQREDSAVSGTTKITYFSNQPEVWKVPLYTEVIPEISERIPEGYIVPKSFQSIVIPKLQAHGIQFREIEDQVGIKEVEIFRADSFKFAEKSFEGHQGLKVTGEWKKEKVTINPGDLFVSTRQPKAFLIFHLFEPKGPDSLLAWGFFNSRFEQKEYMENYVTESVAKEMLTNPEIKKVFEEKLKQSEFEESPEKRLEFFYRLHPSWDQTLGLYPVYRVQEKLK